MDETTKKYCLLIIGTFYLTSPVEAASSASRARHRIECYDDKRNAQRCFPPFVNAAFNIPVSVTNTCGGVEPEFYCQQTTAAGATKSCDLCDAADPSKAHPAAYLTDFHSVDNLTWWQSSTMLEEVQWPKSVNLTLSLGKLFEITYVRLKFHSSRPESFAIYKRSSQETDVWTPYQYYSSSCDETYNLTSFALITKTNEAQAICRDDFSDISPLTGGSVAFSTLEGRPSAYEFEKSPILQDWVTASDIQISLNRINTFRDEVFGDPNVLRSYFYAISDFAVGGRCKCNGHANECIRDSNAHLVCLCQHFTDGPDCQRCLPFYNDQPWHRAVAGNAHECKPCDCNGRSETCYFDEDLFRETGHGGHCQNCEGNRTGPNCERCIDGFYESSDDNLCVPCNCHPIGSEHAQCDSYGMCRCRPGVTGEQCDQCLPNYYNLSETGCSLCQCHMSGCLHNQPACSSDSGQCLCKEYVQGQNCDSCKPGYFSLREGDALGCMPCFCYGHSTRCTASSSYAVLRLQSHFKSDAEWWTSETRDGLSSTIEYAESSSEISASSVDDEPVYFVAPELFHGDVRFSYNQYLTFNLRIEGEIEARPSRADVLIEGDGLQVSTPIFGQENSMPKLSDHRYEFRLNEHPSYQWTPKLTTIEFVRMLANITSIKIRATYARDGIGYLSNVTLSSATYSPGQNLSKFVEHCECPDGYLGQFCESCAPGYHRDPLNGGPFGTCIPCNCNKHSEDCDAETGRCICDHNTTGLNCDVCIDGFYGYPLAGTPEDCKPCPCPDDGKCVQLLNGDVACIDCAEGYTGLRCEICDDGYSGDPEGEGQSCERCSCNDNIDYNAVGNCDRLTGACLKCLYNTGGERCERCLPGHFGEALGSPHGDCKACGCNALGSNWNSSAGHHPVIDCDVKTGQCPCRPHVTGLQCDQCEEEYWNIASGLGCENCQCDHVGSSNRSCSVQTGQCFCKDGIGGLKCDQCTPLHFGFSSEGCQRCNCDTTGSADLQCDLITGQCSCRPNIVGSRCNSCEINKYNMSAGCLDCPVCYDLVKGAVRTLRQKLDALKNVITDIETVTRSSINDTDFLDKLYAVNSTVYQLWLDVTSDDKNTEAADMYDSMMAAIEDSHTACSDTNTELSHSSRKSHNAVIDVEAAERIVSDAEEKLNEAEAFVIGEGGETLQRAAKLQEQAGEQSEKMTGMAQEARDLVEKQETGLASLIQVVEEALNASTEALGIVKGVTEKQNATSKDIGRLSERVEHSSVLFNETKIVADLARGQAMNVHDESLKVLTEAQSLHLPSVDLNTVKYNSSDVLQKAEELQRETDLTKTENDALLLEIANLKEQLTETWDRAKQQQLLREDLEIEADMAKTMAEDAKSRAEEILLEARETLATLKEFDEKVKTSRIAAEDALLNVTAIERLISKAGNSTSVASEGLPEALEDATEADRISVDTILIAYQTTEEVERMVNETSGSKERALNLTLDVQSLSLEMDNIEERVKRLEEEADSDARSIRETSHKASEVKRGASDTNEIVINALTSLDSIMEQLKQMQSINVSALEVVEQSLETTETDLADSNIESRYKSFEELQNQMESWIVDYGGELEALKADVENIRQINDTIPRTCFKQVSLEPLR